MKDNFVWHKDKLTGEYLEVFDKIELYGEMTSMDADTYSERMMDLLDMFVTAQQHQKPVVKIVGSDIEEFCESYFGEYTLMDRLKKLPKRWLPLAWVIFILELIGCLATWSELEEGASFWDITSDMGPYLLGIFIGSIVIGIIAAMLKPFVFKIKWLSSIKYETFTIVLLFAGLFLVADSIPEVPFPAWIVLLVSGIYLVSYYSVNAYLNYRNYGTLRKKEDVGKISFWDEVNKSAEYDFPQMLKKRFDKTNKRLAKKNQPLMTPEEFNEKFRKEAELDRKASGILYILIWILCIGLGIFEMFHSGFTDGCIFMIILFLVEFPMMKWAKSGEKNNPRMQLIEKCDALGITVIAYADGLADGSIEQPEKPLFSSQTPDKTETKQPDTK